MDIKNFESAESADEEYSETGEKEIDKIKRQLLLILI